MWRSHDPSPCPLRPRGEPVTAEQALAELLLWWMLVGCLFVGLWSLR